MGGDLEPQSVKFGKVLTVVWKAVPWHPGKKCYPPVGSLLPEPGGKGSPCEGLRVAPGGCTAWGAGGCTVLPGESLGNPMVFPPVGLRQVNMLKQGAADTGVGM